MIFKYTFNGKQYRSAYAVRQAIWNEERMVFGEEPKTGREEFWSSLGVIYSEEEEPLVAQRVPTLDEEKTLKIARLDQAFALWRNDDAVLVSSLGFTVDADERAMIDISGLAALGVSAVFMDAVNQPHELSAEQLKVLQREIIQSGSKAYQTKWAFRNAIISAETKEELNAIELKFAPVDFTEAEDV